MMASSTEPFVRKKYRRFSFCTQMTTIKFIEFYYFVSDDENTFAHKTIFIDILFAFSSLIFYLFLSVIYCDKMKCQKKYVV